MSVDGGGAGVGLLQDFVVVLAEESVVSKRELIAGDEAARAGNAVEAVQVVDLVLGSHHEVVLAEVLIALRALGSK